jgi:hypothetical protein
MPMAERIAQGCRNTRRETVMKAAKEGGKGTQKKGKNGIG